MSRAKAFWLGLGCTLAVLLPIYLAVAAVIFTRSAPADTVQSGVPIAQPTLGDEKNFLLMTGPEQPETFVLLRFDALEGNLCSVAIPGETVVLVNGRPATLADAAEQAGPAQAAAALMETLDIEIDNYLYCTADRLVDLAAGFGTARIPLANYMTPEALGQLQLNIPGVQTVSLTPQMLADGCGRGYAGHAGTAARGGVSCLSAHRRRRAGRHSTGCRARGSGAELHQPDGHPDLRL